MITYHQLRTFLAVARTASLTKAARELNATQPTVSLQLHALRKFLGKPLFERPGGEFRLTPVGEKLRSYAEEVLGGLRILQQDVASLEGSLAGPFAVGATFVVSRYVLPSALHRFRDQFPAVELQLHVDGPPERLFSQLLSNTLDAVCCIRVLTPPGLRVERLYDENLVLIASPGHPLARRRRIRPRDLSEHPFVVPTTVVLREVLEARLRSVGVTPRIGAEGRHHDAIKRIVERNAGYSLLIRSAVASELASGRLVALRLDAPPMLAEIVVVLPSRPTVSPLVGEFIQFLRHELSSVSRRTDEAPSPLTSRVTLPKRRRRS
jgi:LysR family transcriptional regulator, low CO2-responsive transcriptional regulator